MSDFRQCVRCGRNDVIPGTALDSVHDCPHGVKCEVANGLLVLRCQKCVEAKIAPMRGKIHASLPGAREAFLRPGCGVIGPEAGIANGSAGVVRSK